MADLLAYTTVLALRGMGVRGVDGEPDLLPPPMVAGNEVHKAARCAWQVQDACPAGWMKDGLHAHVQSGLQKDPPPSRARRCVVLLHTAHTLAAAQEALLPLLVAQTGNWSWVDSAGPGAKRHKWGWESHTPGKAPTLPHPHARVPLHACVSAGWVYQAHGSAQPARTECRLLCQ